MGNTTMLAPFLVIGVLKPVCALSSVSGARRSVVGMEKWKRHYLMAMGASLVLFVLAVTVVRPWSGLLMFLMLVAAVVIPLVAVIMANKPGEEYTAELEEEEEERLRRRRDV